jgi:subtilisin family serine protease
MASPHVAGVIALLLSQDDYSPLEMKLFLQSSATEDIISGVDGDTVNLLLFNDPPTGAGIISAW